MVGQVDGRKIHGHQLILRVKMTSRHFTHFASVLVWFRRDLRLHDHTALHMAVQHGDKVFGCFVFDSDILQGLPAQDRRVSFIHASIVELDQKWREHADNPDAGLITRHGHAVTDIVRIAKQLGVQAVFTHHDDEPQSLARDAQVLGELANAGIAFHSFKDHVVFERSEVLTQSGTSYGVFTPYKNAWMKKITPADLAERRTASKPGQLPAIPAAMRQPIPALKSMGFENPFFSLLAIAAG
jgi:deoxyribodipyrimidine photo-lyase